MERIFMTRRRAIAHLLELRQALRDEINGPSAHGAERRLDRADVVERLLFDVRASRIHHFQLSGPPALEVFITE